VSPSRHAANGSRSPGRSRFARASGSDRASRSSLVTTSVRLNLGGSVYDPNDAVGRLLFNVLAMVAEFESDLIRLRTREGMKVAKAKGRLRGKQPKLNVRQEAHLVALFDAGEHSTAELADLFGVAGPPSTAPMRAARPESRNEPRTQLTATPVPQRRPCGTGRSGRQRRAHDRR